MFVLYGKKKTKKKVTETFTIKTISRNENGNKKERKKKKRFRTYKMYRTYKVLLIVIRRNNAVYIIARV